MFHDTPKGVQVWGMYKQFELNSKLKYNREERSSGIKALRLNRQDPGSTDPSSRSLEICPHFSAQRKLFRHWDSGQGFYAVFRIKALGRSLRQEKQKIQNFKDLAFSILIKINNTSF